MTLMGAGVPSPNPDSNPNPNLVAAFYQMSQSTFRTVPSPCSFLCGFALMMAKN